MEGRSVRPVDVEIGQRIRQRRVLMGLSQQKLADAMGLTFQQVQKYETGKNRISAGRLHDLAQILRVPVAYFFDGLGADLTEGSPSDRFDRAETLKLIRAYWAIPDEGIRRQLLDFVRSLEALPRASAE